MILRNYYKLLDAILQGTETDNSTTFVKTDGNTFNGRYSSSGESGYIDALGFHISTLRTAYGTDGLIFGDGTTEPSLGDYCLAGSIITGLTGTVSKTGVSTADGSAENITSHLSTPL